VKLIRLFALIGLFLTAMLPAAAPAQTFLTGRPTSDTNPEPTKPMCWNGTAYDRCQNVPSNMLRSIYWNDATVTALAANASTSPTARDTGAAPATAQTWTHFNCFARADAAGATLFSQGSVDGTTWFTTLSIAMSAAATPYTTRIVVFYRYNRCLVTNGATAQTALTVASSFGA
jgi:hypothetical protein